MTGPELVMLLQRYQSAIASCALATTAETTARASDAAEQLRRQILQEFNTLAETTARASDAAEQLRRQILQEFNTLACDFERVGVAGDRIAHELLYSQHGEILETWWQARGGHARCTVCMPEAPTEVPTVYPPAVPVPCGCVSSDPWKCGREGTGFMFTACKCPCHRVPTYPRPQTQVPGA